MVVKSKKCRIEGCEIFSEVPRKRQRRRAWKRGEVIGGGRRSRRKVGFKTITIGGLTRNA